MTKPTQFSIRYWGVTGSFTHSLLPHEVTDKVVDAISFLQQSPDLSTRLHGAASEAEIRQLVEQTVPFQLRSTFGGNTSCFEVVAGDTRFIVDAGSGLRELGIRLNRQWNQPDYIGSRSAHVLITHTHMDHTFATPFNDAYYDDRNDFTIWGTQAVLDSLTAVLGPKSELRSVYFPIHLDLMRGVKSFMPIEVGSALVFSDTTVQTYALNHPGGCIAYRFDRGGRRVVFATDHEHRDTPDSRLATFAHRADLLYLDAQYLQNEYDGKVGLCGDPPLSRHGWGHSTVESAIETAIAAEVQRLHLGHHDPKRSDAELMELQRYAGELMRERLEAHHRPPDSCSVRLAAEGLATEI